MIKPIIYLATPYSHPDPQIRLKRFETVNTVAAHLMNKGEIVFSPISHGHGIALQHELPTSWDYWEESCKSFIYHCDILYVLLVDGWQESQGVQEEIKVAKQFNKEIKYFNVDTCKIQETSTS